MKLSSGGQEVVRWVAMVAMVVDHVGAVLLPDVLVLRLIGRLAWPLFAYLVAYNVAVRGVDPLRYALPLLGWGVVSIAPHWLALGVGELNILFTLFLGVLAIACLQAGGRAFLWLPVLLVGGFAVSYGPLGVALPVLLWVGLSLDWRAGSVVNMTALGVSNGLTLWSIAALPALAVPAVVSVLRVGLPRARRIAWAFYPVHLVVLLGASLIAWP